MPWRPKVPCQLGAASCATDECHLRGVLSSNFCYYHATRTHLSLDKESRTVYPPAVGKIIAFPEVGGLHHRYERRAA